MSKKLRVLVLVVLGICVTSYLLWLGSEGWNDGWSVIKAPQGKAEGLGFILATGVVLLMVTWLIAKWLGRYWNLFLVFVGGVVVTLIYCLFAGAWIGGLLLNLPKDARGEGLALAHDNKIIQVGGNVVGWGTASRVVSYPDNKELTFSYRIDNQLIKTTLRYGCPPNKQAVTRWYCFCRINGFSDQAFMAWHLDKLVRDRLSEITLANLADKVSQLTDQLPAQLQEKLSRIGLQVHSLNFEVIAYPLGLESFFSDVRS